MQGFDKRVLRAQVAKRFLRGEGIEIGALGTPLDLPEGTRVRYVDRMSKDALYREYPELAGRELVDVDIVDDGESLLTIPDDSLDFIVGNHFMEHCQEFLGTLLVHARKLRKGGFLFYAIPNRSFTFDELRPNTTLEHLIQDHEDGPDASRAGHYLEWARLVVRKTGAEAVAHARTLEAADYSIHFHAWDAHALFHCLGGGIVYLEFPGFVAHFEMNGHEVICLIGKH